MIQRTFPRNWVPKETCINRKNAFLKNKLAVLNSLFPTKANSGIQRDSIYIEDAKGLYSVFSRFLKYQNFAGVRIYIAVFGNAGMNEIGENDANCLTVIFTPVIYSSEIQSLNDIEEYYTIKDKKLYQIQKGEAQIFVTNYESNRRNQKLINTINSTDPYINLGDTRYLFYDKVLLGSICDEIFYQINCKPRLVHGMKISFTEHINKEMYASRLNVDFLFTDENDTVIYIEDIDNIQPEKFHVLNMDMATPCPPGLSSDPNCSKGTSLQ